MFHEPVLKEKAVELLVTDKNGIYVDGTLGGGGHAESILQRLGKDAMLIGMDMDSEAIAFASNRLKKYKKRFLAKQANFKDFGKILDKLNIQQIHGLLLDLGVSSHQIETAERGFSFSLEGKLDMRMDVSQKLTAFDIINMYSEEALVDLLKTYGEEKRARLIVRALMKERKKSPIETTTELKKIVTRATPPANRVKSFARVFQALRIEVNAELQNLTAILREGLNRLVAGGRLVVISYHSLEDRIVKKFFKEESERCVCPPELPICVCGKRGRMTILTKRPLRPSDEEISANPRSRSAKLRAAEKLEDGK